MSYELVLFTIVTASTPFLLAALGELVTERAGVLNLGVEGMMAMGAACGFAAAITFDSNAIGVLVGMLAGMLTAAVFALAVLGFAANQVGCGLALTIFGLGVAGMIGNRFVGLRRIQIAPTEIPFLSDIPFIGKALFSHDIFVYVSIILTVLVAWFLSRTRLGLMLRSVGENHVSAQALGLPVRRIRLGAILFGGACSGLAGVYLSLVYTGFWAANITASKGWIAVLLVVFAAWRPVWLVVGAYIFGAASVLQLHAQAAQLGIPSQLLSSVPYVVTIVVLVILAWVHGRNAGGPGSLGNPYITDR
ncbi:ABC transporter permease [Microvirga sp. W0021]|uniref:ABC transporter permease n=1 Tax=Hohaiivirga grylli TaxID=3133970 RepID=A0ABV0BKS9_9HYPH